jgi:2-oxoisovalerate dehydrogenase E2 component (dihydrolipoyl transacylase)
MSKDTVKGISGSDNTKALSTPSVRHLAKLHNIDINQIRGTGRDSRVTKEDVLKFIENGTISASKVD